MELSVTTNSPEYRNALIKWMATFGKNARESIKVQGRFLGERLIAFTPPRNQKQGRDRVRKDIQKIIMGIDDEQFDKIHYVLKGDTNIVRAFVNKQGVVYGVDKQNYMPNATAEDLSKFHQAQRDQRGRVSEAGQKTRDIGRWKFITMLVAPQGVVADYIATVSDRVGRGRGGWAEGVLRLKGKVAQWVAVHARTAGEFRDFSESPNPSIEFVNKSEWASGGDQDRIMENAINARIRDINASIRRAIKDSGKPFHA